MDGKLTGADALPRYAGSRTAVPDARVYDLIDVAADCIAPDVTVVGVRGEVDLLTAPVLRAELRYQLAQQPSVLVIDLTLVIFFGASGVEVLIDSHHRARRTATSLRLAHKTRAVGRLLEILQLDRLFPTYPKLADALTV